MKWIRGLVYAVFGVLNKSLKLYSLMTTKPEEVEVRKQKEIEE